jgi:hypothetical protein
MTLWRKKRKFEMGRPATLTKLGQKEVHRVRVRGGNYKYRAIRMDTGNYSWGSESKYLFNLKFYNQTNETTYTILRLHTQNTYFGCSVQRFKQRVRSYQHIGQEQYRTN